MADAVCFDRETDLDRHRARTGWSADNEEVTVIDGNDIVACHTTEAGSGRAGQPGRHPLIVIDAVDCIQVEAEAATCFFRLISNGYERTGVIVTSTKPFRHWGEVFGDATVVVDVVTDKSVGATVRSGSRFSRRRQEFQGLTDGLP
ncbi:ATP-binding protein [Streptomyces sp. NBC_00272]|uniref:ATP-binding protein n=1 Tax=Streptomyces sp. NBC_00272 TaxID=2975698 RepID=UPI002E2C7830|nr:ATP-binding protein [Streptomyces sp. NBC_00272]